MSSHLIDHIDFHNFYIPMRFHKRSFTSYINFKHYWHWEFFLIGILCSLCQCFDYRSSKTLSRQKVLPQELSCTLFCNCLALLKYFMILGLHFSSRRARALNYSESRKFFLEERSTEVIVEHWQRKQRLLIKTHFKVNNVLNHYIRWIDVN